MVDAPCRKRLQSCSRLALHSKSQPEAILRWAVETYGPKLTMATAFGVEGCVLLAMLSEIPGGRDVRVFNLETGYQFPETLALRETIKERYGIEVEYVRARESLPTWSGDLAVRYMARIRTSAAVSVRSSHCVKRLPATMPGSARSAVTRLRTGRGPASWNGTPSSIL